MKQPARVLSAVERADHRPEALATLTLFRLARFARVINHPFRKLFIFATSNRRHIGRLVRCPGLWGIFSNLLSHRALELNLAVILEKQILHGPDPRYSPSAWVYGSAFLGFGNDDPGLGIGAAGR